MVRPVESLICRLEEWLKNNRPEYYKALLPGLGPGEIAKTEKTLGVSFPEDLRCLYSWRDGQDPLAFVALIENLSFLSSKELVEHWEANTMLLRLGEFAVPDWWDPAWIPFLHNGGGDLYCIDTAGVLAKAPDRILYFDHESENRTIEFDSLEAWLKTVVESLEAGCWLESNGEMIPDRLEQINDIYRENNPEATRDA